MTKRKFSLGAIALLTGLLIIGSSLPASEKPKSDAADKVESKGINWMAYDVGLVRAKKEGKHVFVDFTATWCGWCKKMERETFSQPEVIKMLNDNFVSVRVDGDSKNQLDIEGFKITETDLTKREFMVRGYPAFWFLKSDGSKLTKIAGYQKADIMMRAFDYIATYQYDSTLNADGKPKN